MEYPIIFSTEMVKAYLERRKTMTRRVMRPQPPANAVMKQHSKYPNCWLPYTTDGRLMNSCQGNRKNDCGWYCPYGQVGSKLWIRETIAEWQGTIESVKNGDLDEAAALDYIVYKAGAKDWAGILKDKSYGHPWNVRPSIHMPRWASRITLEIKELRVERLQDITEEDAKAEGIESSKLGTDYWNFFDGKGWWNSAITAFSYLWDSLNAKRGQGWEKNPWIWCISFRRVDLKP